MDYRHRVSRVSQVGRTIRLGWLALGLGLLGLLAAETLFRVQASVRDAVRSGRAETPASFDQATPWYQDILAAEAARVALQNATWEPYVEWAEPEFHSTYYNVDSLGHRRTVQACRRGDKTRQLFVFGGSLLVGSMLPDSATIPSQLAMQLAARRLDDLNITNLGKGGQVFAQEVFSLMLQLRSGARPAAVVFLTGGNEVASALDYSRAGFPRDEATRVREFNLGQRLYPRRRDVLTDIRVMLSLTELAAQRFWILNPLLAPRERLAAVPTAPLAAGVAQNYVGYVGIVEALAQFYGFFVLYAWEPNLFTTDKPLSPFEQRAMETSLAHPGGRRLRELRREVHDRIAPVGSAMVPGRFVDLTGVFAHVTATAFLDEAHTSLLGSAIIGKVLAEKLALHLAGAESGARRRQP